MEHEVEHRLKEYLESINIYALRDLEKMLLSANYNSPFQRLAIPIALTCFSLLDIIGFLIRDDNNIDSLLETSINIKKSLKYFFNNEITEDERDIIIELYRKGLTHTFFPKFASINNDCNDKQIITFDGKVYNFNVNPFANLLIQNIRIRSIENFADKWEYMAKNYIIYEDKIKKDFGYLRGKLPRPLEEKKIETTTRYIK